MSTDTNLLKETLEELDGRTPLWVGSTDGQWAINWGEFHELAKDVNYYAGFGAPEIARDLVVVCEDGWLEREEYDGAEGWTWKQLPVKRANAKPFTQLEAHIGWQDLAEINSETDSA